MAATRDAQYGIWCSRIYREIELCADIESHCPGCSFYELALDESIGMCCARFYCFVPFREGSSALPMLPLTILDISMPYIRESSTTALDEQTKGVQYPFSAPSIVFTTGAEYLPNELVATKFDAHPVHTLRIPTLYNWTPSTTLVSVLQDFIACVQKSDPQPSVEVPVDGIASTLKRPTERLRLRKRDIHGCIYSCREVDPICGQLRYVPLLLQSGNVIFLSPPSRGNEEYMIVEDLVQLKDIARITPQHQKSITFFFVNRPTRCRTLLTTETKAIIANIEKMIAVVESRRVRSISSADSSQARRVNHVQSRQEEDSLSLAHLLSFLTSDQTEKAKDVSNKIVGKLSRWGNSVSKFLRGEEVDRPLPRTRDPELLEIDELKTSFYRFPSRAQMTLITNKYQQVAESYTFSSHHIGKVEGVIEELQAFIEHPSTQRILIESSTLDNANRGIRVSGL